VTPDCNVNDVNEIIYKTSAWRSLKMENGVTRCSTRKWDIFGGSGQTRFTAINTGHTSKPKTCGECSPAEKLHICEGPLNKKEKINLSEWE
jgi:hypothetical protein